LDIDWTKETETGKIDLPDDDREAVKLLVQYLYEADYEPKISNVAATNIKKTSGFSYGFPHSCHGCNPYYQQRNICPHHICGQQCDYDCYAFTCKICAPSMEGSASQLLTHAQLYELADKYSVVGLKALCQEKFKHACLHFWNDENFSVAANYVFSTTPDHDKGLRDIVSTTISDHMVLLKKPEIEALMTEFNGLAFGLLKAKAAESKWI
jgi:hypothetical protein